ncbi:hypothetical protein QJS66_21740 [Kocuria rhizophila]|nr:hypothetical protein QJS66_21740 [Kocuria rhizophila]
MDIQAEAVVFDLVDLLGVSHQPILAAWWRGSWRMDLVGGPGHRLRSGGHAPDTLLQQGFPVA